MSPLLPNAPIYLAPRLKTLSIAEITAPASTFPPSDGFTHRIPLSRPPRGGTDNNILSLNAYRNFDWKGGWAGTAEWGTGAAMFAAAGPSSSVLRNSAVGGFSAAGGYLTGTIASGGTFSAEGFAESFAWGAGLTGLASKMVPVLKMPPLSMRSSQRVHVPRLLHADV